MNTAHVWRAAQERLRQQMTRAQYDTWLRGTWLTLDANGISSLCVRTTFAKELLETRFRDRIEAAINEVTGQRSTLRIVVAADDERDAERNAERVDAGDVDIPAAVHTRMERGAGARGRTSAAAAASIEPTPTLFSIEADEATVTRGDADASEGHLHSARRSADVQKMRRPIPISARRRTNLRRPTEAIFAGSDDSDDRDDNSPAHETGNIWNNVPAHDDGTMKGATSMSRQRQHKGDELPAIVHVPLQPDRTPYDASSASTQIARPKLNPRYTFSTFIVGSGNQLAHAASQAVAEAPGQAYNPLFLYGGVGLGKTHLLHAIGHSTMERELVVLYVSSETFTNEIINAIRYRTTEEFRAKYRSVDVLLVDDIQFIAGKESTEEEFFHTFNSLYETSKQIVICSDRPPKAIVSLEERLRSRFEWGLIADIQPPDLETRVAILRAKSEMMGRRVPDDVISFLASRVQSNIRELEGSLNRLLAFVQLQGLPLTAETAKAALANLSNDGRQRRVTIAEILDAVAEYYRISPEDLCGKQRDKHIVVPRQVAMYLMRQETEASLLEIGQALGGRDHSTVLHGCEKIGREINDNTTLRKEVLAIRQQLLG
ncbi:MAG: Chromosomal replication initiator protein DnaA [Ktedonobacterales bacterium]|nr:MAG: Chromosomal replication initiator protein DnaA [Ktedonobacterales bacterium]